jgi:hypothetical protein
MGKLLTKARETGSICGMIQYTKETVRTITLTMTNKDTTLDIERRGNNPRTWTDVRTLVINTDIDNFTLTQHSDGVVVLGTADHSNETLAPTAVVTKHLATEERSSQVVCRVDENHRKYAVGPNGIIADGYGADDVLQAAANWLTNNGYGTMLIHDRMVIEDGQLTIPDRVRVHCSESGELVNELSDTSLPFVHFEPGATAGWLRVNANGRAGITLGGTHSQSNIFTDQIYMYNVGDGQTGIRTRGYQISGNWWHVQGDGNYDCTGFDFQQTSDVFVNSAIAVGTTNGAVFDTTEHVFMPALDCDSGRGTAITLGDVHDIHLGCTVWCNTNEETDLEWETAIDVIEDGHTQTLNLDANVIRSGRRGLRLADISASRITITITNEQAYPPTPAKMDVGIDYGPNVSHTVTVTSQIDPNMQTAKIQGTPAGTLNGTGYEAATDSATPTLDAWNTGQFVINTDDDTAWLKQSATDWTQLS